MTPSSPPVAFSPSDFDTLRTAIEELVNAPTGTQALEDWRALQKRVDELCAALTARPPEEAHTALPDLAALIAEMDRAITVLEGQNPAG